MLLVMAGFVQALFLLIREPQFEGPSVREFDFNEPDFPRVTFWLPDLEDADVRESELLEAARRSHLIGDHPDFIKKLKKAERYARSNTDVLIMGEPGTGKELLPQFIHKLSDRSSGPFLVFNCSAIPEEVADSELFGHEKGAFTGALYRRVGLFEAANGGAGAHPP
jgi:transcriptional regulator with GAF, ATPase, and Fis domain